jgi:hypothetical protein
MLKYVLITVIIIISRSFYGSCRALNSRFVFLNLIRHVVGHLWTNDISSQRPLPTQDNITYSLNTKTNMPRVGFEPAIPVTQRPRPTP